MARDTTDETVISGIEELAEYLADGCKPKENWRIGTEHEKFPYYTQGNSPVPYEGTRGIRAILQAMQQRLGWDPIIDEGNLIGLVSTQGQGAISLEPGGQFELSGAPLQTIHQTFAEASQHLADVHDISTPMGIRFLGMGGSPKWTLAETPVMPKSRYAIMTAYMPKVGKEGLDMMYRTSTIQVNLDFASETDMRHKMQVGMKLQSVATALFASSPFTEGKPNGLQSWRSDIWRDTDNNRAGVLPFVFSERFGFADYVDWALDVPMYFIMRDGHYVDCTHITFRQFMHGAMKDHPTAGQPNIGDWANHISTLFPEVRLKRFLEMRGADGGPLEHIAGLSAFWVGLLYDEEALNAALDLTKDWSFEAVAEMRNSVPKLGFKTPLGHGTVADIARQAVSIAQLGLKNRKQHNEKGQDETIHLAALEDILTSGQPLAETMLQRFNAEWNNSIDPVFQEYSYK
ncbi:glutamate--cysteine ligase [Pseudochrobactrum sp. MP213Fo]|uniref:glutamate--cysteine ligase n=1 Tax=Pseudochrobactrum sp. MP213Fo TaxID=3022250 RepID=UPI003BA20CCE